MSGVPSSGPLWFDFFRGTLTYLGEGVRQRGSYFLATWPEERNLMSNWFIYSLATSPLHRITSQGWVLLGPELCEVCWGALGCSLLAPSLWALELVLLGSAVCYHSSVTAPPSKTCFYLSSLILLVFVGLCLFNAFSVFSVGYQERCVVSLQHLIIEVALS